MVLASWLESTREQFAELAVSPAVNLHLTLAFLGEVGEEQVAAAGEAVREVAASRRGWSIEWTATGVFPATSRPRVLWLGVGPNRDLDVTHRALREALAARGLPVDARAFHPHLTLARVRRGEVGAQRRDQVLAHLETLPAVPASTVVSLVLYRSELGGGPAVHSALLTAPLG